jgi:hypothetical protein
MVLSLPTPLAMMRPHPFSHWLPCSVCPHPNPPPLPTGLAKFLPCPTRFYIFTRLLIALMMEAVITSETLENFCRTARRNIPEDSYVHTRRRGKFKLIK